MTTKLSTSTATRPSPLVHTHSVHWPIGANQNRSLQASTKDMFARVGPAAERRALASAPPSPTMPTPLRPEIVITPPQEEGSLLAVRDRLYLTDLAGARSMSLLEAHNIRHALLCSGDMHIPFGDPLADKVAFRRLGRLYDDPQAPLGDMLPGALTWIKEVLEQGGQVLVACRTAKSCSAAVLCAYLMWSESLTFAAALDALREVRPDVAPNPGFAQILKDQEWRVGLPPR